MKRLFLLSLIYLTFSQHLTSQQPYDHLSFRNVGPTRGGRVTAVAGHPGTPGTFFMGATGGGVWKTTDYGFSWQNLTDTVFASPSIGSIAIASSDKSTVYVGTGSDGIRSNVIIGKGIYKSVDAGASWTHMGLESCGQIGAVVVHPDDPDVVLVAALGNPFAPNKERGIYKTIDGGSSWSQVYFHSDSVGAIDLEFHPENQEIIYATLWRAERKPWTIISGGMQVGGVYKSSDGGDSWKKCSNGLPNGLIGKSDLAVTPAEPNSVWALVEAPIGQGGLYKSTDQGENFELISTKKELLDRPFYYCNVDVNPINPSSIYVNSTSYWHSGDGGASWQRKRTPHGDNHDLWINPTDTLLQIQCNDGGANVTRDGGKTWSSIENQSTSELYQVNVDDQVPYWLYAGQQDNSTISVPSLPPSYAPGGARAFWMAVGGCETGPAIPKPGNPNIVYSNCKGRFGTFNKQTGQEQQFYVGAANMYGHNPSDLKYRFQRVSPIHVSPHNPDLVYHASQYVHATTDDGKTWQTLSPDLTAFTPETQKISGSPITRDITGEEFYSTIYALEESSVQAGIIWTGANDGPIHVSRDGGRNWKNVTPSGLPAGGRVQTVAPSPHQAGKAIVSILRYQLGDFRPYSYLTTNYGDEWQLLTTGTNGIPADHPVRVVREDPQREGLLFAGTEFGLFISFNNGRSWSPFQLNLPITPITDLKIHDDDLIISTMGRGFWILDDIGSLRQDVRGLTLFTPSPTYMLRYRSARGDVPNYPPNGVYIDYYLPANVDTISLAVKSEKGTTIRTFTQAAVQKGEAGRDMATGFERNPGSPDRLSASKGSHRLLWDMRHMGLANQRSRGSAGPRVAPGRYTLVLKADEQVVQKSVLLKADPRIIDAGITIDDLVKQESLALNVLALRQEADLLEKKISAAKKSEGGRDLLNELHGQLKTAEGRYQQPMLLDQIRYLYSMITRADQAPGKDAEDRYAELKGWLQRLQKQTGDVKL